MTEATEARSLTTTMVIDHKNVDAGSPPVRSSKKTFTDDLYATFSSPLAWILVLALIITWSFVFVIMFDLTDYKAISGHPPSGIRKVLKDSGRRGGLSKIGSDPVKAMNDAVEESANVISLMVKFAANLIAPAEDEGNLYAVRKKGEFLPSRSKVIEMQAKKNLPAIEVVEEEEEEEEEGDEVEAAGEMEEEEEEEEEEDYEEGEE
uniref:Triadin n=1 Tax=Anabas testudineus TaxID=64144 RepID=A0A3Q1KDU0_ANATE